MIASIVPSPQGQALQARVSKMGERWNCHSAELQGWCCRNAEWERALVVAQASLVDVAEAERLSVTMVETELEGKG